MRIVGGLAKGCPLLPPGALDIRPTSDKARQALFNMIDPEGAAFLDLFAGTGAVGLEAASRGAAEATLVESSRKAAELARKNTEKVLRAAMTAGVVNIVCSDVMKFVQHRSAKQYGFIFCDPPYMWNGAQALFDSLLANGYAGDGTWLVYECARKAPPKTRQAPEREKRYGDTLLLFYRF
ncbi:MAG: RsmD family RNA methyltransferase [Nitrospinae bacterium]|nr:RsmD family RNA methyltransferase [Nitrospinota bacterium]